MPTASKKRPEADYNMVYNLTNYDGTPLTSVQDSTLDTTTTSITLIGRNAVNFGLALNENFIALMQHFSNSSPPPSPITGQIWFDTVSSSLKVWEGSRWLVVTPPFDGNAGTATVSITPTIEIVLILSAGQIVCAISHDTLSPAQLSDEVEIAGSSYSLKARFPTGMMPGVTMATDANGYQFVGTATSANVLTTGRTISLTGSATGNVMFNGSNDVVITTSLINVLNANINTSSYWSKVLINSNGTVSDANVLVDQDIFYALGYTPPSDVQIVGDAIGNAVANGTVYSINVSLNSNFVAPGTYNNVTVDGTGRVIRGSNDLPVPVKSIVMWDDILIPNKWAWCNGQTVTTTSGVINTPNLVPYQVGPTRFIVRTE